MTPLLPLAPISAARAIEDATSEAGAPSGGPAPSTTAWRVRNMFVPVSPSGTGNTFSAFTLSMLRSRRAAAEANMARRSSPLRRLSRSPVIGGYPVAWAMFLHGRRE